MLRPCKHLQQSITPPSVCLFVCRQYQGAGNPVVVPPPRTTAPWLRVCCCFAIVLAVLLLIAGAVLGGIFGMRGLWISLDYYFCPQLAHWNIICYDYEGLLIFCVHVK